MSAPQAAPAAPPGAAAGRLWPWLVLPALALAAIVAFILVARPLDPLARGAPPVEELAVEAVWLTPGAIHLTLRADGSEPVRVAQVQVDGAWRAFTIRPGPEIGRLGRAEVEIPYPWVEGEAHHIVLITGTGVTFEHTIEVAQASPVLSAAMLWQMALAGLFLGLAPVSAGLLAWPALRQAGERGMGFLLAVTVGLLGFLLIDTLAEGLEAAEGALGRLRAGAPVWAGAIAAALVLMALGRRGGRAPEGVALAAFIAFGIGVHNFGEGLAVGAALSTGAAALATFLLVGFAIHNVSEGFAIAAPMARARPSLWTFAGLAALAGLPAIPGVALGALSVGPLFVALAFAIGAGAILQVIVEAALLMARRARAHGVMSATNLVGVSLGLAVMYLTALLA